MYYFKWVIGGLLTGLCVFLHLNTTDTLVMNVCAPPLINGRRHILYVGVGGNPTNVLQHVRGREERREKRRRVEGKSVVGVREYNTGSVPV